MAKSVNITFYFNNQTAYDLVSDGVFHPWGSSQSGQLAGSCNRISAHNAGMAFKAEGTSEAATGVTGAVNYWYVSAGANLNSKTKTKGSEQFYFSIAFDHDLYKNKWSHHNNASSWVKATYAGWSSEARSVTVTATYAQTSNPS